MGFLVFFFLGFPPFAIEVATQVKSSMVVSSFFSQQVFASATNPESEEIQRASSHTQGTNKQGPRGIKIPVKKPRNKGNS